MTEKYLSGILHPSEVFEDYLKLDIFDKERFIQMLTNDEQSAELLKNSSFVAAIAEEKAEKMTDGTYNEEDF